MEDNLIAFETAKLAKNKGFSIPTKDFFGLIDKSLYALKEGEKWKSENHNDNELMGKNRASAPTQSLLQRWLRETHNIHVTAKVDIVLHRGYGYWLTYLQSDNTYNQDQFISYKYLTYEHALENGLLEALNLIE